LISAYLRFCQARSGALLLSAALLTLVLATLTYPRLSFSADRQSLFRTTEQEQAQRAEFQQRFGDWMDLIAVLDGGSQPERERIALQLGEEMRGSPLFQDVRDSLELPELKRQALYFLSVEELRELAHTLARHQQALRELSREGWYGFLEHPPQSDDDQQQERFRQAWRRAVESRGSLEPGDLFPRMEVPQRAFFTDGPQRHLIFFRSEQPLEAQRQLREMGARLSFSGRLVTLGQPLLQAQEEAETVRDAAISTFLSIVLVQLLLIYGFRETSRPRLAFLSLLFGLFWSTAWAAVSVGQLNIITVNFLSITVGLGIDFSIHFLARYAEEREQREAFEAMWQTWWSTGLEILVGAVATSLAFFALLLTDFQAVKELGLITGVAILLCLLSVIVLLPPLIFWHEGRRGFAPLNLATMPWVRELELWLRAHPVRALALGAVATVLLALAGSHTKFDYNLLNLQSDDLEAVVYEKQSGFSTLAGFVVADSPAQALQLKEQLEKLPSVSRVSTVAELFPSQPEAKEPLIRAILEQVRQLPLPSFDPQATPDWTRLRKLSHPAERGRSRPDWVDALANSGPGPVETVWRQMQVHLHAELQRMLGDLRQQHTGLTLQQWRVNFPALLRYSNEDGKTLLRVQSKVSLWERTPLTEFTRQLESVTDQVMGPPFLIRDYLEQMRASYYAAVRYAVVAIVLLLLLYFRCVIRTFIALIPKIVGTVGMLGAMGLCGVDFNPANCMALPLTLGIGLVFGIHALHRCLEHPEELLVEGSTGKSISLAAWTDITSFGTMLTASSPGIFSIGFVMAVGVGANLLATYLLVPPLVVLFRRQLSKRSSPG
jgi:predicted RND superfamily exporter protein